MQLSDVFEQGVVYADKWSPETRAALDIPDPLTDVVSRHLAAGVSVIITGNAGDGKSHLAHQALAPLMPSITCHQVTEDSDLGGLPGGSVVFVRDASALSDEAILRAVRQCEEFRLPLLITINEGPLASLATSHKDPFFERARNTLHSRESGGSPPDPEGLVLINLAGRQLSQSSFIEQALVKVINNVVGCSTCGKKSKNCPRVVGATMLKRSVNAKFRIAELLRLLTSTGRHLTARDIWIFCIDLFYGHTCTVKATNASSASVDGYFWTRLFEDDTPLPIAIQAEFNPLLAPFPQADVDLWQGNFNKSLMGEAYPGPRPVTLHRANETEGRRAFASAKRAFFLFSKKMDIAAVVRHTSSAPEFRRLLELSLQDPAAVAREVVGRLNTYRLQFSTETELWVSRHHSMTAHKRVQALAASHKVDVSQLIIRVPYIDDMRRYPESGFYPHALLLQWKGRRASFTIDYEAWTQLHESRTLAVDREQELLDFAIDLFMAQAPVEPKENPEIRIRDHKENRTYQIRTRHGSGDRGFEVLA